MKHVLVISTCCITNHSKTKRFKTTNNLFSHSVCRSRIQVSLSWAPLAQGLSQGYSQGVRQSISHLKVGLGYPLSITCLVTKKGQLPCYSHPAEKCKWKETDVSNLTLQEGLRLANSHTSKLESRPSPSPTLR